MIKYFFQRFMRDIFLIFSLFISVSSFINAQTYLGFGLHVSPPIRITNCCNEFVNVQPLSTISESFSRKKHWINKNEKEWYRELGITKAGVSYRYEQYYNSTEFGTSWVASRLRHSGFHALFYGIGRIFKISKKPNFTTFSIGVESALRLSHTLGRLETINFRLRYSSMKVTFPLFLRPNISIAQHFKLFKRKIPAYVQLYTKLSFQDIARGVQEIRDVQTNMLNVDGIYELNYSEIGMQLYVVINKEYYKSRNTDKKQKSNKGGQSKKRLSITHQLYQPKPTRYFIPQVDSFYLGGLRPFFVREIGLKAEFLHAKNDNWSTLLGLGFGELSISTRFRAEAAFVADGIALNQITDANVGNYLIPQIGLAYKHQLGRIWIQHSLSTTFVIPFLDEKASLSVFEQSAIRMTPPDLERKVLSVTFEGNEFQTPVIPGLEYQGEVLFRLDKRIFVGVGFVFNKSFGSVTEGDVLVQNNDNQYIGGFFQSFSKIGASARIGVNLFDETKMN